MNVEASSSGEKYWDLGMMPASLETSTPKAFQVLPHLNQTFMKCPSAPDWGVNVNASISLVPPVPNMLRGWSPKARRAIGEGIARRVAPDVRYPSKVDGKKCVELAIAELGFYAHAALTCLYSALEAFKQGDLHEEYMATAIKNLRDEAEKRNAEFQKTTDEISAKMEELRKHVAAKDGALKGMDSDISQLKSDLKKRVELARQQVDQANEARRQAEGERDQVKITQKSAEERLEVALADLKKARDEVTDLNSSIEAKVAEGVEQHKKSKEFEDSVQACYTQGINHMSRCFLDATDKVKAIT